MAANLMGGRFVEVNDRPAWHKLGQTLPLGTNLTANDAADLVDARYDIGLRPLSFDMNGVLQPVGYSMIVRAPTADDPIERVFGEPVSNNYELIKPTELFNIWDLAVRTMDGDQRYIETFGVLDKGAEIFISTKTFNFNVTNGKAEEEVETYMVMASPMRGNAAVQVLTTAVRVVCQNTLNAARRKSLMSINLPHHPGVAKKLEQFLHDIYLNQINVVQEMADDMNAMASAQLDQETFQEMVQNVFYKLPKRPRVSTEKADALFQYNLEKIIAQRSMVMDVFNGGHPTNDTELCRGTHWGAYNAVTLCEDSWKTRGDSAAYDVLFGGRGDRMLLLMKHWLTVPAKRWPNFYLTTYLYITEWFDREEWLYVFPSQEKLVEFQLSSGIPPHTHDILIVDFALWRRLVEVQDVRISLGRKELV